MTQRLSFRVTAAVIVVLALIVVGWSFRGDGPGDASAEAYQAWSFVSEPDLSAPVIDVSKYDVPDAPPSDQGLVFLAPKDGDARTGPLFGAGSQPKQPVTYLSTNDPQRWTAEHRYLRGREPGSEASRINGGDFRYSTYSLAYYLVGALGEDPANPTRLVDGVSGPGFMQVNEDGTFKRSGKRFGALIDPNKGMGGVAVHNAGEGRIVLKDGLFARPFFVPLLASCRHCEGV